MALCWLTDQHYHTDNDTSVFLSPAYTKYTDVSEQTVAAAAAAAASLQVDDSSWLLTCLRVLLSWTLPGILALLSWVIWGVYFYSFRSKSSSLPLPPGSMGFPFIGETCSFLMSGSTFYKKRRVLYGNVFKTHLFGRPTVRVVGASNVRKVLMGENTLVTSFWPSSVRLMLGSNNITMSTGEKHRLLRRAVLKAFNHDALSSYAPEMQKQVRRYISHWHFEAYVVSAHEQCRSLSFAVVCRALLGMVHLTQRQTDQLLGLFETFSDNLFSLPIKVPGFGLSKGLEVRKHLLSVIDNWIEVQERLATEQPPPHFHNTLQLLIIQMNQHDTALSREYLKEVCLDLMFTGHSTVSSASTSLLYFLARTPRVVKKVLTELEEHGLRETMPDDLTFDSLSRLTYVDHVVKEVLRLMPPVGAAFRRALKTFEIDGYQIPEGWAVAYSIRETHAFSPLFTDIDQFQPERWESPSSPGEATFNFIPFGRGARSCVGKEYAKLLLKILTVEMCRSCHWRLVNEEVEMKYFPVPHPVDGLPMLVTPRLTALTRPPDPIA